jgi:hypothetical protein
MDHGPSWAKVENIDCFYGREKTEERISYCPSIFFLCYLYQKSFGVVKGPIYQFSAQNSGFWPDARFLAPPLCILYIFICTWNRNCKLAAVSCDWNLTSFFPLISVCLFVIWKIVEFWFLNMDLFWLWLWGDLVNKPWMKNRIDKYSLLLDKEQ